jgi:hypothetical protein
MKNFGQLSVLPSTGAKVKTLSQYVVFFVDWTLRITAIGLMAYLVVATFTLMLWNSGAP